jgi:hypothetical protein
MKDKQDEAIIDALLAQNKTTHQNPSNYNIGLYNGMILIKAILDDKEPLF